MKTRLFHVSLLTALLFSFHSFGQKTLHGTVLNDQSIPVSGAKVSIENTFFSTRSNSEGKFTFTNVALDEFTVLVEFPGYEASTVQVTGFNQKETSSIDLQVHLTPAGTTLEEVQIVVIRADNKTPTTFTNVSKEQLGKLNFGQDLPILLEQTPSAVTNSDAGAGVGYTGIRIRGVDPTRTNVTINGIPINDPESHGVYWVNMPDFASSVQDIQIQRGVGTSSNGAAAFGASINIKTDNLSAKPYGSSDNSVGSFGTVKNTIKMGTGQLNNGFSFDGRMSRILSDGYIDRASSNLHSFFLAGAWAGKKTVVKANVFSGHEVTYQSWYGTPESRITGDVDAMNAYADRNYLSDAERENLLNSGRTYNYYTYDRQVDDYAQDHYQLHFSHSFNANLKLNVSGHYTYGRGYYEEYKAGQNLVDYGLDPLVVGVDTVTATDLIRRKWLDNHFYGAIYSLSYSKKRLSLTLGGAANQYVGDHFGEIIWAQFASNSDIRQRYYGDSATKSETSHYLKAGYEWNKFYFYADGQVRYINYNYLGTSEVNGSLVESQETTDFLFFNPKIGMLYDLSNRSQFYGSFSIGNREPVRDDFRQPVGGKKPRPEQLQNTELGYRYQSQKVFAKANGYLMNYKDQLILTGQINDVGGYTRTNVKSSYRAGIELEAGAKILPILSVSGNLTLSQNKVKEFIEYVDDYDNGGQREIVHRNRDLAFSPNVIGALAIVYEPVKHLEVSWTTKYVGQQYLDNTQDNTRKIDAYLINNFGASYTLSMKGITEMKFSVLVNNVLNEVYQNNGYTFSYIYGGSTTTENFYYPQAGRNFLARVSFNF